MPGQVAASKKGEKKAAVKKPATEGKKSVTEDDKAHVCPICVEHIVDEGEDECAQDALYCEGDCQCWLHRWCAGVTRERYAVLSSTEDPFLCPSCTVAGQQVAITAQQADIPLLRECVKALTDEVRVMKASVAAMQSQPLPNGATSPPMDQTKEWSVVVSKGKGNGKRSTGKGNGMVQGKGSSGTATELKGAECSGHKGHATSSGKSTKPGSNNKKGIPVDNARKIWGTLRATACSAVTSAIKRLTSASLCEKLTVKRKFKATQDGKVKKWWFVVRGNKPDVELLVEEWHKIEIQTGWKLEPVLHFDNSTAVEPTTSVHENSDPSTASPPQQPATPLPINVSQSQPLIPILSTASPPQQLATPIPINVSQSQPQFPNPRLPDPPLSSAPPQ